MSSFAQDDASEFSVEALTGATPAPEGQPGESAAATAPERPRNEKGQFAPTPEEPGYDPELQPLLDKYGGDVNKALRAAMEAQSTIGSMASELGQLRQVVQAQQWQQNQPEYDYAPLIEEDANQAAQIAFQNGDTRGFTAALTTLAQEDPTAAEVWRLRLENIALQRSVQQELAQVRGFQTSQALDQNLAMLAAKYPDVSEVADTMATVLQERPTLRMAAMSTNPQFVVQALEDAYQIAKARTSDTLGGAAAQVAQAQAQAHEQALRNAYVGTTTRAVGEEPQPNLADAIAAEWATIPTSLGWGK